MGNDLTIVIKGNSKQAQEAIRKVNQQLKNTKKPVKQNTSLLKTFKNNWIGVTAAIGVSLIAITKVIRVAMKFEQAIANVKSVSGGTTEELEKMARMAGKNTVFSASKAADALYFLASAGLKVSEMNQVLTPTLDLAAAAQMGIAEATDLVIGQLKTFQAGMGEAQNFTDIMAKTVASSNTNMEQLGGALSYAASIAKTTGIKFKDLNVMIASMADLGLKGERAGTQLRMAITRLIDPTSKAKEALEKYDISLKDVKDLLPTPIKLFEMLRSKNISNADALKIFGVRQTDIINLMKNGEKFINQNAKALDNYGGAAKKMAEVQINTLQGSILLLKSQWEEFLIMLNSKHMPTFKDIIDFATWYIKVLQDNVFAINYLGLRFGQIFDLMKQRFKVFITFFKESWEGEHEAAKENLEVLRNHYESVQEDMIEKHAIRMGRIEEAETLQAENHAENLNTISDADIAAAIKAVETEEDKIKQLKEAQIVFYDFTATEQQKKSDKEMKAYTDLITMDGLTKKQLKKAEKIHTKNLFTIWKDFQDAKFNKAKLITDDLSNLSTDLTTIVNSNIDKTSESEKQAARRKAEFARDMYPLIQGLAHSQALMNSAGAVLKTIETFGPPFPPNFLGIGAMAVTVASGLAQQMAIAQAPKPPMPTFEEGGSFTVPEGYPNDSYPMAVTSGEHVEVTPVDEEIKNEPTIYIENLNVSEENTAEKMIDEFERMGVRLATR